MLTTESFYESFDAAGFLVPATWTPSAAAISEGATAGARNTKARFREIDEELLDGIVVGSFPSLSYPASWLPGLIEGEVIALNLTTLGQGAAVNFAVRDTPRRMKDGTEMKAFLRRV